MNNVCEQSSIPSQNGSIKKSIVPSVFLTLGIEYLIDVVPFNTKPYPEIDLEYSNVRYFL